LKKRAKVHLKVDTGMGRIGASPSEAENLLEKIHSMPGIEVEGVFTHFAKADDMTDSYTAHQLSVFKDVTRKFEEKGRFIPLKHAANSAATLYHPDSHLDMVRIGLAMYGLYPNGGRPTVKLLSALSFKTTVTYVKRVPAGTYLSYGSTYRTERETTIATLPVGYADGYSRALSNKASVLIRGKRFPVAGRVCMDMTLVDVGDERVEIGDEVGLIGAQGTEKISAGEIAAIQGTITYEVVCGIGKRVPRVYKK
jgi:alanine racemase